MLKKFNIQKKVCAVSVDNVCTAKSQVSLSAEQQEILLDLINERDDITKDSEAGRTTICSLTCSKVKMIRITMT